MLCTVVTPLWIEEYGNNAPKTCKDDDDDDDRDEDSCGGGDDGGDEHLLSRTVEVGI